jgi:hypothetical protein
VAYIVLTPGTGGQNTAGPAAMAVTTRLDIVSRATRKQRRSGDGRIKPVKEQP